MNYTYIIIPLIVVIATQAVKLLTDAIKGNFTLKNLFISYGGMPSAHTAFATSITTLVGITEGFESATFGVALVFTILVMRDASTFRNILGNLAQSFNKLVEQLPKSKQAGLPYFRERVGHSLLEVAVGALWGIGLTWLLYLL